MVNTNLWDLFVTGGWVMWPLLILSIFCWAVIIERSYVFLTIRPKLNKMVQSLRNSISTGDMTTAKQICLSEKSLFSELFLSAIDSRKNREKAERTSDRNRAKMSAYLKKNLWVLGTIGSASPFIGLLGTVVGIIRAFHDMSTRGAGGFSVVAAGISEALIATAAGLIVAIVSLIAYNIFTTFLSQTVAALKIAIDELIDESQEKASA